jgi:hypothetical protein
MEKSLQEKFDNINLDEIPDSYRFELETIQEETDSFKDEDALEIFQKNFNYIYFVIGKKHPTALKDYTPPAPTAEELGVERDRVETEKVKQDKLRKAKELADKYKKKETA